MKKLTLEQVLGLVRHTLTTLGVILIMTGKVDESNWTIFTGSVVALASFAWSVFSKPNAI